MSTRGRATAVAHANIALVKYWGKRDEALNLPAVGSLSLTLAGLTTRTAVRFESGHVPDAGDLTRGIDPGTVGLTIAPIRRRRLTASVDQTRFILIGLARSTRVKTFWPG